MPRFLRESERDRPQATCDVDEGAVGSRPDNRAPTSPARLLRDSSPRASGAHGLLSRWGALEQLQRARELEGLVDDWGGAELKAERATSLASSSVRLYERVERRGIDELRLGEVDDNEFVLLDQRAEQGFD